MHCCENKINNFIDVLGLIPQPYQSAGTLLAISEDGSLIRVNRPDVEFSVDWEGITNKPTTLDGYGITDAYTTTESDERFAPVEHTHHVEDIVDFPEAWSWDDITDTPTTLDGYGIADAYTTTESDERFASVEHTHHVEDIIDFPETWAWDDLSGKPQSTPEEIDTAVLRSHTHANKALLDSLLLNNGGYIAYDSHTLSTYSEGILHLDSKYFTPVDNGLEELVLHNITWDEIQGEYNKYQAGLTAIQTNKSGLISISDISFNINNATIYFNYRFSHGDYDTGLINIYQALISATEANILTRVNVLHTFTLSDNNFTDFYKNLIETTNQQAQENTTAIEALKGAIIYIGEINLNTDGVTQQSLTDRAAELGYDVLQAGYTLIDLDNNQWTYNGTQWINIGNNNVSTATNDTLGVVKGSADNLKVSVDIQGEMSVNGLESTLNNKADKATTLMGYGITDAYTKTEADASFAKTIHTHTVSQITDFPTTWSWNNIANTPTTLTGYGITAKYAGSQTDGGAANSSNIVNLYGVLANSETVFTNQGALPYSSTSSSTNYPTTAPNSVGVGFRMQRSSQSEVTSSQVIVDLWGGASTKDLYFRKALGGGTSVVWGDWQQFLSTTNGYTKTQVNTLLNSYLPIIGGTITGNLIVNGTTRVTKSLELYTSSGLFNIIRYSGSSEVFNMQFGANGVLNMGCQVEGGASIQLSPNGLASSTGRVVITPTGTTINAQTNTPILNLTATSGAATINFARASYNYLSAPTDGSFAFLTNGASPGTFNPTFIISDGVIYSGTSNSVSNGQSTRRWSNVYSVLGDFSGQVTSTGFVRVGSSDNYVLLGGGGHSLISNFATSAQIENYLPLKGGTLTGALTINAGASTLLLNSTATQGLAKQDGSGNTLSGITFANTGRLSLYTDASVTEGIYIRPNGSGTSTGQTIFSPTGVSITNPTVISNSLTATTLSLSNTSSIILNRNDTNINSIIKNANGTEVSRIQFNSDGNLILASAANQTGNGIYIRPDGVNGNSTQTSFLSTGTTFTTPITVTSINTTSINSTNGFIKAGSSNEYVLLAGGGTKSLDEFPLSENNSVRYLHSTTLDLTKTVTVMTVTSTIAGYRNITFGIDLTPDIVQTITSASLLTLGCYIELKINGSLQNVFGTRYFNLIRNGNLQSIEFTFTPEVALKTSDIITVDLFRRLNPAYELTSSKRWLNIY